MFTFDDTVKVMQRERAVLANCETDSEQTLSETWLYKCSRCDGVRFSLRLFQKCIHSKSIVVDKAFG